MIILCLVHRDHRDDGNFQNNRYHRDYMSCDLIYVIIALMMIVIVVIRIARLSFEF